MQSTGSPTSELMSPSKGAGDSQHSTMAMTPPGGGKKLYQEQDIGKLAVLRQSDSSVPTKFAMCVAAASVAECVTYPLDLTKTR